MRYTEVGRGQCQGAEDWPIKAMGGKKESRQAPIQILNFRKSPSPQ
jgi:hypothetical protein